MKKKLIKSSELRYSRFDRVKFSGNSGDSKINIKFFGIG